MKRIFVGMLILIVTGCVSAGGSPRYERGGRGGDQGAPSSNATTLTGTMSTAYGKGGMANQHLVIQVVADDGSNETFYLMKGAIVTESDGTFINYMADVHKGKRVEIRYSVTDGQKRVLSMHYLN